MSMNIFRFPPAIRALLSQSRAFLPQCRSIHLYQATKTKATVGNSKIIDYEPVRDYINPANVRIDLWIEGVHIGGHIGNFSLREVIQDHLKPGVFLVPKFEDHQNNVAIPGHYRLKKLDMDRVPQAMVKNTRGGQAKELHFHAQTSIGHFMTSMYKAYHFLNLRHNLEIQLHKKGARNEEAFATMLNEAVHLRPDVMLRAMPPYSGLVINPVTNFEKACWVFGPPRRDIEDGSLTVLPRNLMKLFHMQKDRQTSLARNAELKKMAEAAGTGSATGKAAPVPKKEKLSRRDWMYQKKGKMDDQKGKQAAGSEGNQDRYKKTDKVKVPRQHQKNFRARDHAVNGEFPAIRRTITKNV